MVSYSLLNGETLACKRAENVGFAHDEKIFMVKLDLGSGVFPK